MEVKPCNNAFNSMLINIAGMIGGSYALQSGNSYLMPAGAGLFSIVALNVYRSASHAHVKATPGELSGINEVTARYKCSCCGSEEVFTQDIRRLSFLQVEDIKGKVSNVRTVGTVFKKQLVDLVGEDGKSVLCLLPKRYNVQEGQELTLDARLTKVRVDGTYKTGLEAYALITLTPA